ncbi:acetyl-CoA carboxylase biotin carboxyl carrier protein [Clostridium ganghwense]|uniref:Biotin carboxyl carrier protein of acetyl-CoA carboxylase n=1 Tax=Clostridium ganghwense TaxID=312089 RepID=A0ABT4CSQ3_9CLOT|nr:acetyl-CoA carboxylase biotin carboxyl carrier protein [Clostridium ganghwense]MCY6372105.1 acetyl-CoA carboxylase biotin carboxyl carrier protein [Clostridium ganghwense]
MDYTSIQELIKTMSDSKLSSLEIETEGIHIKMRKDEEKQIVVCDEREVVKKPQIVDRAIEEVSLEVSNVEKKEETSPKTKVNENVITVKSPIVGTFYGAPAPEEDAFVSVGSKVKKGDTLCIIEAMKLMNEIEAEDDYEIVEILVENEEMVEYGQPIFNVVKL